MAVVNGTLCEPYVISDFLRFKTLISISGMYPLCYVRGCDNDSFSWGYVRANFFRNFKHCEHPKLLTFLNTHFMRFKASPVFIMRFFRAQS